MQDVHQDLWKGANRKFDIIPWRKIEKERHNAERSPEQQVWPVQCLSGVLPIPTRQYRIGMMTFRSCLRAAMGFVQPERPLPVPFSVNGSEVWLMRKYICSKLACHINMSAEQLGIDAVVCCVQKARLDRAVRRDKQRQRRIRQSGIHYSYEPLKDAIQQAKRVKLADDISKPMELGASAAEAATAPEKGAQAAKAEGAAAAAPKKGPQGAKAGDAAAPGKGSQAAKDSAASKKESAAATVADSSAPRKAKRSAGETDRVVKKAKGAGVDDGDKGAAEKLTAAEGNEKAAPKDHKSPRVAAGSAPKKGKRAKADMDSAPAQLKRAKLVEKKGKRAVKAAEKKAGKGKRSKMQ